MSMILIVEDDVFIHEYMEIIIQEIGHETLSARDMDGALSHLHAPQQIDLLVTDIYLKKACSGGIELAHQDSTEIARALHDRKRRHRRTESALC